MFSSKNASFFVGGIWLASNFTLNYDNTLLSLIDASTNNLIVLLALHIIMIILLEHSKFPTYII